MPSMQYPSAAEKNCCQRRQAESKGENELGPDEKMKLSARELLHAGFSELVVSRELQEVTQARNFKH